MTLINQQNLLGGGNPSFLILQPAQWSKASWTETAEGTLGLGQVLWGGQG